MPIVSPNYQLTDGFVASAARTANGNSTGTTVAVTRDGADVAFWVNVTAVSGTMPTLDLRVQWSLDGTTWYDGENDTFTQRTATGAFCKRFPVKARQARLAWTVGGTTPSFTFSAESGLIPT